MKERMKTKARMPEPDERLHTVPLANGLQLFGELIESKEHWIFVCDEVGRLMLKGILENYCINAEVGQVHFLLVPIVSGERLALAAIKKTLVSARQLKRELRSHVGLKLSGAEILSRDLFIATSNHRVPFAVELIKYLTGEGIGVPIYGCPN